MSFLDICGIMRGVDNDELQQAMRAAEIIAELLQPIMEEIADLCRKVYAWARDVYHAHGTPYGNTHEGLMRWWDEVLMIARLRQEAELLEQRHRMLAEMRAVRL